MSGDRIARAMARIEAASSRIERIAPRETAPDPELDRKYAALRSEAGAALAELDQLIGEIGR